jgi:hypothetical protein
MKLLKGIEGKTWTARIRNAYFMEQLKIEEI